VITLLFIACGGGTLSVDSGSVGTDSGVTSTVDSGTTGDSGTATGPVSFADDIVPVFYGSCGAGVAGCHTRDAYKAEADDGCNGWLSLEDEALGSSYKGDPTGCADRDLYTRLTELVSWQCKMNGYADNGNHSVDWPYVQPGNLEESYLWQKIVSGGILCDSQGAESQPMPIAGPMPADELDLIKRWIEEGAQNN